MISWNSRSAASPRWWCDDGFSPPKTVEQVLRLVEQDQVDFLFSTFGTPTSTAIERYCNQHKVPQLFLPAGADKWGNYKQYPWTIGWIPSVRVEAQIYTKYMLKQNRTPNSESFTRTMISARTTRAASRTSTGILSTRFLKGPADPAWHSDQDMDVPVLLPGIKINTSPTNYHPIRAMQLVRWDSKSWVRLGEVIEGAQS